MLNMGERGIEHLGAQTPLKHLYPAVNQRVTALPTCWNYKDKNQSIALVPNQLTVQYKGQGASPKDAASVRANNPIPSSCGIYYFEVKIISKGRDGYMGIGLSAAEVKTDRLPGWDNKSYGYHGDDGNSFCCSGHGQAYGPTFTTADVIGCCVNLIDNSCFFTKNGVNLGVAFRDIPHGLYPTVGLQTPGEVVEANFGQQPFVFDVQDYMQEYKMAVHNQIDKASMEQNNDMWQSVLQSVVLSHLLHYGYSSSAESFAKHTGQSLNEETSSIRNRQRIQSLVLSGQMSEAINITRQLYPGLLDSRPNLLFKLKCRQFVEMINGTDAEIHHSLKSPRHNVTSAAQSNKSSPALSPHPYSRSVHSSGSSSPYRHPVGSPHSTHSNGTHHSMETANGSMSNGDSKPEHNGASSEHNGDTTVASELNGNSNNHLTDTFAQDDTEEDMEVDISPKNTVRPLQSAGNELTLIKILQFGRELKVMNNKLNETQGTNEENNVMLEAVFSLLAYADPWSSPVGSQLDPVEREPVCADLNRAILESQGLSKQPILETLIGQTNETLNHMAKGGVGSCAFAQLRDYVPLCKMNQLPPGP